MEKEINADERQIELLEELVKWAKIANYEKVKEIIAIVLDEDNKKKAYMFTGSHYNRDEICKNAKISKDTLTELWKQCLEVGLIEKEGSKYRAIFDLENFGLVPKE